MEGGDGREGVAVSRAMFGWTTGLLDSGNIIADALASPARLAIALMRKDVRSADGRIVTAFGFNDWQEGNSVQIIRYRSDARVTSCFFARKYSVENCVPSSSRLNPLS